MEAHAAVNGQTTVTTVLEGKEPINDSPQRGVNKIVKKKKTYKNIITSSKLHDKMYRWEDKLFLLIFLLSSSNTNQSSEVLFSGIMFLMAGGQIGYLMLAHLTDHILLIFFL